MPGTAAATIIAKNYLSYARVLARSFLQYHPDIPFFALLIDDAEGYFDPALEPFRVLRLPLSAAPRGSVKEVAAGAKPYLLQHLLDQGFSSVLFLDPDILVLDYLGPLLSQLQQHAVVLTPHLTAPLMGADRVRRELNILQSGVYNGGVVGVSESPSGRRFLEWWRDRLDAHCGHDIARGLYYDQRWLDLAPVFFDDLCIFRDPSFNVAYWNLPERDVSRCRLMHFSGFDFERPDLVTRYLPDLEMRSMGEAASHCRRYATLLESAGYHQTRRWPFGRTA